MNKQGVSNPERTRLRRRARRWIRLHDVEGQSLAEIGRADNVTKEMVRRVLLRVGTGRGIYGDMERGGKDAQAE